MSSLLWVTAIISNISFAVVPNYSKLVNELDKAELRSGQLQEQYDIMENSIISANDAVSNLEKDISLKEQSLTSKKMFARARVGALLRYSVPEKIDLISVFDDLEGSEKNDVLLRKMLKQDVNDYNDISLELGKLDELKKILGEEKNKLEQQSQKLSFYINELKRSIAQKKLLLEKIRSSEKGSKILVERSKQSANKITGLMYQGKGKVLQGPVDSIIQKLIAPIKGNIITPFGKTWDASIKNWTYSKGVRVGSEYGKEVRAAEEGIVSYAGWIPAYGRVLIIKHEGGFFSVYGHLSRVLLSKGAKTGKGMVVGFVGDTGSVESPSLYFEVSTLTNDIDPSPLFY